MRIHPRVAKIEYAIREVVVPARKLKQAGHRVLHLNIGDPNRYDFDTPEYVKKALVDAIQTHHNYYAESEGEPEVLEAIAKREKRFKGLDVSPNDILTSSGASEAVAFLMGSLVGEGKDLLMPGPSYPLYISLANYFGGKTVEYKCDEQNGWNPDVDDLQSKITKDTNAILVINPNNPTGAVYDKETLTAIADIAADKNILVISDEIYDMMSFKKPFYSIASLNENGNYVCLGGLSKVYLAPGWRVGYAVFKGNETEKLKEACYKLARGRLSSSTPGQYALKAAVQSEPHLKEYMHKLETRAKFATKRINEIDGLSVVEPDGTLYMFPKIENEKLAKDDKKFASDLLNWQADKCDLKNKKCFGHPLVVFGSAFGEEYGKGHFRLVYAAEQAVLEQALDRLEGFMKHTLKSI
ncbi:TPA: aminotransferase class I/II-fold pyridoxal phosphate-dependent enzyme [archaeon]|nr:aminotransferase class I/II-fold pyridoxal phosphate-dependent enzyme [Candidatus Naiadarchaeales archaeon SRR2090159.bin1288]